MLNLSFLALIFLLMVPPALSEPLKVKYSVIDRKESDNLQRMDPETGALIPWINLPRSETREGEFLFNHNGFKIGDIGFIERSEAYRHHFHRALSSLQAMDYDPVLIILPNVSELDEDDNTLRLSIDRLNFENAVIATNYGIVEAKHLSRPRRRVFPFLYFSPWATRKTELSEDEFKEEIDNIFHENICTAPFAKI